MTTDAALLNKVFEMVKRGLNKRTRAEIRVKRR
jgi:hypothetical protein